MDSDKAYGRPGMIGGASSPNVPSAPSDTIDGMIGMLGHPISELHSALERLKLLNNRLSGPRPPEAVGGITGGEIRKDPPMLMKFAERHSEISGVTNAIHAEITRLEQVI